MSVKRSYWLSLILLFATITNGFLLSSASVFADNDVIDEINLSVPASCSISGVGMNSHTASIINGSHNSNVGTTTFKVLCNDSNGFAIYAIGYTDNIEGKTVMASAIDHSYDIITGTATTGNSQWAMKLSTVTSPTPTYPVSIQNSFNDFHTIPDDYTLVAKRELSTDIGTGAEGASFTSTYQVYISPTQPASTYVGQVKYVLVHPNDTQEIPVREDRFAVLFDGNGLTFTGGATKNRVVYGNTCTPMYTTSEPEETLETSNLTDGVYDGTPYSDDEHILDSFTLDDADMVRAVVDYGLTGETAAITIAEGEWDGSEIESPPGYSVNILSYDDDTGDPLDIVGTKTVDFEGDTVTLEMNSWEEPIEGYDYGMYAKFYPLYETQQSGTVATTTCSISSTPLSGAYAEPTSFSGRWYTYLDDEVFWFEDESEVFNFVLDYIDEFMGTTVKVYAENPYTIFYNGNGATAGTMNGVTSSLNDLREDAVLIAPNFKKIGYGFAGWSESQNTTVNGSARIYGPNEVIPGNEINFDNNREITLYAVWVPSSGNLQEYNCSNLASGQVTALTDTRDDNVYTVSKMQDGNCWMMENLRLDASNSTDSSKTQGFGGVFTGLANSEDIQFRSNTSNSKYSTSTVSSMYRLPRYNNNNTNIGGTNSNNVELVPIPVCNEDYANDCTANLSNHAQWYSYGNYYNYPAAIANTTNFTTVSASDSANTSICPKGWVLPYGGTSGAGLTNGSFSYLDEQMGGDGFSTELVYDDDFSQNWLSYPNNFTMAGYWSDASGERGTFGAYWSRTSSSDTFAWRFTVTDYSVGYSSMNKTFATPIRCIIIEN